MLSHGNFYSREVKKCLTGIHRKNRKCGIFYNSYIIVYLEFWEALGEDMWNVVPVKRTNILVDIFAICLLQ